MALRRLDKHGHDLVIATISHDDPNFKFVVLLESTSNFPARFFNSKTSELPIRIIISSVAPTECRRRHDPPRQTHDTKRLKSPFFSLAFKPVVQFNQQSKPLLPTAIKSRSSNTRAQLPVSFQAIQLPPPRYRSHETVGCGHVTATKLEGAVRPVELFCDRRMNELCVTTHGGDTIPIPVLRNGKDVLLQSSRVSSCKQGPNKDVMRRVAQQIKGRVNELGYDKV